VNDLVSRIDEDLRSVIFNWGVDFNPGIANLKLTALDDAQALHGCKQGLGHGVHFNPHCPVRNFENMRRQ
jgi:hypothetical protein